MCCEGDVLQPIIEELAATRTAPEGEPKEGLSLQPGPAFVKNPITGKSDVPLLPHVRQIFVKGMRIGYVTTSPGGPISLLRPWLPPQLEIIRAAVLEELALNGFDLEEPRRFHAPRFDGLLADDDEDDDTGDSPIILPE
jgi:hypothetical protein